MKNLTKIFLAVAVAMLAFACVTDTTEDLGVKVDGQKGVTELTLSLEESRTQLGEKVDGFYPLYWSKGDKISVNGVESGEAIINQSNPASATFAVQEAESYAVAYPAAAAGQVLFAEKQSHVAEGNTFASGVSTMYGYGTDRNAIQLNHLTGVLKVGIKGEATLAKAQISTIDRAPIAGAFDIDFATGELEATTVSKDVIEYSFGEAGLQLSSEAQYIYVAVPAGQYDELYITLYEQGNSDNVMYATVKAGTEKPLVAGNVREFKNDIEYAPNATLFVINSVETLQAFKAAIEAEGGLAKDAILTEDIDMTGVEWTPINSASYVNTFIGNGYAIKGLTAPLFGITSASFKGVHLENVNITINGLKDAGSLACAVTANDTVSPKVENCSVSGTFTVDNTSYAPTEATAVNYGGLVGYAYGATVDNCQSGATVTIKNTRAADNTQNITCYAAGLAASIGNYERSSGKVVYSETHNSKNIGNIKIDDEAILGYDLYIGGVYAYAKPTALTNISNEGDITIGENVSITRHLNIGGVFGRYDGSNISNVSNSGNIEVKCGSTGGETRVGGIFGYYAIAGKSLTDVTNTGNITITGNHKGIYSGGIIGIQANDTTTGNFVRVVNGALGADGKPDDTKGKITIAANSTNDSTGSQKEALTIAGLNGGRNYNCRINSLEDCHNYGDIEVSGTHKGRAYLCGITMGCSANGKIVKNCSSQGDITFSGKISTSTTAADKIVAMCLWMSGFSYTVDKTMQFENFKISGNYTITEEAEISVPVHFCGFGYVSSATLTNCECSGNYIHAGKQFKYDVNMGVVGSYKSNAAYNTKFTNSVNMEFKGVNSGSGNIYMASLGRQLAALKTSTGTILNRGTIKYTGSSTNASTNVYIGGLYSAVFDNAIVPINIKASGADYIYQGDIEATGSVKGTLYVGGIIGNGTSAITGGKVYCNIKGYDSAVAGERENGHIGMITGSDYSETVVASECAVGGTITVRTKEVEDGNGDKDKVPMTITLSETSNIDDAELTEWNDYWYKYIYGSGNPASAAEATGCSLLTSAPSLEAPAPEETPEETPEA